MQLKKLLQGSVFAAAAAVCVAAGTVSAQAADGDFTTAGVGSVTIDTTKQELKATAASGELLVGVGKVNAKKGTITVATWDSYTGTGAQTVDLSKLNNTKDNYLVLSSNKESGVSIVKIPAADKAISAKFDPSTAKLAVGTGANGSAAKSAAKEITDDTFEYRTAYGSWKTLKDSAKAEQIDLTGYQHEGATLYVRAKGTTGATATSLSTQSDEKLTYGETEIKVYLGDKLPGKEAKVNIPARAKGPAVAVDYAKGSVTLPKESEYRLATTSAIKDKSGSPVANAAKGSVAVDKIFTEVSEATAKEGVLEVRAVAKEGKKAASKWTRVAIKKADDFGTGLLTAGNTLDTKPTPAAGETKEYGKKGVAEATLKEDSAGSSVIKAEYVLVKKKDALKITNSGKLTYEIVTADGKDVTTAPADAAAKKVAPGKSITITGVKDEASVFIRIAGDKKTKTWVGNYGKLGVVDYPKTVTGA